jgi:hypothetical protein
MRSPSFFLLASLVAMHDDNLRGRIDADLAIRKLEADLRIVRLREERQSQ